ncbi:MAG: T9SS type A sorting domain-containing protein [Flavobacterium sp.]
MKKLLLILLISASAFSQNAIDIRLVDANVGRPVYSQFPFLNPTNTSNDAGLNAILSTYGATLYEDNIPHPYPAYYSTAKLIRGNVSPEFLNALTAYSSVIAYAKLTTDYAFTDALEIKLLNGATGIPTGVSNNVIVTNDAGLNTIFQNFNVYFYQQMYPSIPADNDLSNYYDIVCNCDSVALNAALSAYSQVVQTAYSSSGGIMLSNPENEKAKAVISPNPFSANFNIETEQTITDYSIIDISGKTVITTSSKEQLDNQLPQLSAGVYILNLVFDNGQKANYKLVKK